MTERKPVYWSQMVRLARPDGTVRAYGPFWYSWYYDGGKRRKRYHGKKDPRPAPERDGAGAGEVPPAPPFLGGGGGPSQEGQP